MSVRTKTYTLAVHCSATKPGLDIGAEEIDAWHKGPPNNWSGIGYHLVIRRSGVVEPGRPLDAIGSHVKGYNSSSVGVCLVGGLDAEGKPTAMYTEEQWVALMTTLRFLRRMYPDARIQGHRDFPDVDKACPSFDVRDWLRNNAADLL